MTKNNTGRDTGAMRGWLEEPVYKVTLMFIRGGTCKEAEEVLDYLDATYAPTTGTADSWFYRVDAEHQKKGYEFNALWWDGKDLSNLVHECVHLALSVFNYSGVDISWHNEEALAYYIDYWFNVLRTVTENDFVPPHNNITKVTTAVKPQTQKPSRGKSSKLKEVQKIINSKKEKV